MDHSVGDENVWYKNFGVIDKDVAAGDGNGDLVTCRCCQGLTVFERRAITDRPFDD